MLTVPDKAIRYILFQRTGYLQFASNPLYRLMHKLSPGFAYKLLVDIESTVFHDRVQRLYSATMEEEYQTLQPYLPENCTSVLDIGCGIAGVDAFIWQHYQRLSSAAPHLYLLDKSKVEDLIFYGYKETGAFYNSLGMAKVLLQQNGVDENAIHLIDANDANTIPMDRQVDLVVSLLSWGYHYPVRTYLEVAHDIMSPGAHLILDIRKGSEGIHEIARRFPDYQTIVDTPSHTRVVCTKL